ncbi:XDD4 family exosortase-dependent surface protein [Symmachiella dynata]|uniref:XDD4 family exosortase-dependent surface protein n=1 Tax=Symmachiella dynata TaxID=2527995 RepID=UPI0030B8DC81
MSVLSRFLIAVVALGLLGSSAQAESFMFSQGTRAAQADFDVVGGNLQVTLTNTSAFDTLVPVDVLTALYFDILGNPSLSADSARVGTGSSIIYDTATSDVGGEWAYRQGIGSGALPDGQSYGLSSTGMGVFGRWDIIGGPNLAGPVSPGGLQYGIASAGDNPATGNGGIRNTGGLIKNSAVFTLSSLPPGFSLDRIDNVRFQYGTSLLEPSFLPGIPQDALPAVPEPSSFVLLGIGAVGLGAFVRRRRRLLKPQNG